MLAWPDQEFARVGDEVTLVAVASTATDANGAFELRTAQTPALQSLAAQNGGYLNLVLRAAGEPTPTASRFLSRYFMASASPLDASSGSDTGDWMARPAEKASPVDLVVAQPRQSRPFEAGGCADSYKLLERRDAVPTVVGELQTPADTQQASFEYGKRADSDVSVAIRAAGGRWALSGEHHVGNSRTASVGKARAGSNFHGQILSAFDYGRYEHKNSCVIGTEEVIRPITWHAESTERFYPSPGCGPNSRFLHRFGPGHKFDRSTERSMVWGGAAEVFGASLSARSGYSEFVSSHWEFGTNEAEHLLCGNDDKIQRATRIYAGPLDSSEPCLPGRPC